MKLISYFFFITFLLYRFTQYSNFNNSGASNTQLIEKRNYVNDYLAANAATTSSYTAGNTPNSIFNQNNHYSFDLTHEAELLEKSAKKNDKYTVRRILDAHYSEFQMKPIRKPSKRFFQKTPFNLNATRTITPDSSIDRTNKNNRTNFNSYSNTPTSAHGPPSFIIIPSIFLNILHIAIENNAIDVLRICLKYGLNANEPGTNKKTLTLISHENNQKLIKNLFQCSYCMKKYELYSQNTQSKLIEALKIDENLDITNELDILNNEKEDIYNSIYYLRCLPPIFLTISKCFHSATELLLEYGTCTNIQDLNGNTPLHIACAKSKTCSICINLLLKHHASSNVMNNIGHTPESIIDSLQSTILMQDIRYNILDDLFISTINGCNPQNANTQFRSLTSNSTFNNGRFSILTNFNNISQNSCNTVASTKSSIKNIFCRKHKSVSTFDVQSGMPVPYLKNKIQHQQSAVSEATNTLPKSKIKNQNTTINTKSNPVINKVNSVNKLLSVAITTNNNRGNTTTLLKKSISSQSAADCDNKSRNKNLIIDTIKPHEVQVDAASFITTNESLRSRKSLNKSTFSSTNYQSLRSNDTDEKKNDSSSVSSKFSVFKKIVSKSPVLFF